MTKYKDGRPGYEFITRDDANMELVFFYDGKYYRKNQIMKYCRQATNKSWNTITRWIEDTSKWSRLEEIGVYPYLAAPIIEKHLIVTNGDILNCDTLRRIVVGDVRGKARVMEDGLVYEFYPSSLVYYKFLLLEGEAFDPEKDTPFLADKRFWSPDISNLRQKRLGKNYDQGPQYIEDQIDD